jgi:alpha 1,2-mannosyltransferase
MLINAPQCTSSIVRLGALAAFVFTCAFFVLSRKYEAPPSFAQVPGSHIKNATETSSTFNASVVEFWQELASAVVATVPQCEPFRIQDEHLHYAEHHFDPLDSDKKAPERLLNFTDQYETALFRAHYKMRKLAQHLSAKLPFSDGTTGIVTTANLENMPVLLVSLRMLRRTGCNISMEVFIDDWTVYDKTTCEIVLPSLNARCVVLSSIYAHSPNITKSGPQQHKTLSILFSTFQNVLFLDSDTFPVYDPTVLFTTPPYTTHGLVTWPDFFAPTTSPHYFHVAGIPPEMPLSRRSTDSGQMMLNKHIHRESLLMMIYYTHYGPDYYFPLLSQSSNDDKETFALAALATNLPFYQVRTAPKALGRWWNGTFRATGLAQADPETDFDYSAPFASHMHPSSTWQKADLAHPDPIKEKQLNVTRHTPPAPKPVFIHQNLLRMHPAKLLLDKNEITYEPHDGTRHRMWGFKEDMEKILGFDVERRLWDVVEEEACRELEGREECGRVREYVREVFGWMESIDRPW